jgi:hypothetical protein
MRLVGLPSNGALERRQRCLLLVPGADKMSLREIETKGEGRTRIGRAPRCRHTHPGLQQESHKNSTSDIETHHSHDTKLKLLIPHI